MIWVFGLLAVCAFRPQQNFRKILILISISAALGQFIYPWWYASFLNGNMLVVAAHAIRIITLIWATVIMWRNLQQFTINASKMN
jgi:hypothetical protein